MVTGRQKRSMGAASASSGLKVCMISVTRVSGASASDGAGAVRRSDIIGRSTCSCSASTGPSDKPCPVFSASHTVQLAVSRGGAAPVARTGVVLGVGVDSGTGVRPSNKAAVVIGDVRSTNESPSPLPLCA